MAISGHIKVITDFNITYNAVFSSITKWKCTLNNMHCPEVPVYIFTEGYSLSNGIEVHNDLHYSSYKI